VSAADRIPDELSAKREGGDVASPLAHESSGTDRSLQLALAAARTAAENRGQDIVVLDLREQTPIFDYFVLATGTSRRQLHAMSEEIDHKLERDLNDHRLGIEGYAESRWILLDYGSVVVHLFDEETRAYYDLENLWGNARRLDLAEVLAGV
jgi:ribosome-associated protein